MLSVPVGVKKTTKRFIMAGILAILFTGCMDKNQATKANIVSSGKSVPIFRRFSGVDGIAPLMVISNEKFTRHRAGSALPGGCQGGEWEALSSRSGRASRDISAFTARRGSLPS